MIECPGLLSCPGLTLASIYSRMLDCRVKPGNDEERSLRGVLMRSSGHGKTPMPPKRLCGQGPDRRIGARWDSVSFR
jgi:hypothetical protein